MPFILCDEHGGTPCSMVCPHIFDDFINSRSIGATIQLDAEHLGEPAWRVHICLQCATKYGYSHSQLITGDDAMDTLVAIEQSPVCQKCFHELCGLRAAD